MWGRAESARHVLRLSAESVSPLAFGRWPTRSGRSATRPGGLRATFLVMLVPLAANGVIMLFAAALRRRRAGREPERTCSRNMLSAYSMSVYAERIVAA